MINYRSISHFCSEDVSLIENYELAINDSDTWDIHHRLETDANVSVDELKSLGLYFNRPANELIFLTKSDHHRLHMLGNKNPMYGKKGELCPNYGLKRSDETKAKMSKEKLGDKNPMYGKHHDEATKAKMAAKKLGEKNPMYGKKGEKNPNYGKRHSEVTKAKMAESAKYRWAKKKLEEQLQKAQIIQDVINTIC